MTKTEKHAVAVFATLYLISAAFIVGCVWAFYALLIWIGLSAVSAVVIMALTYISSIITGLAQVRKDQNTYAFNGWVFRAARHLAWWYVNINQKFWEVIFPTKPTEQAAAEPIDV